MRIRFAAISAAMVLIAFYLMTLPTGIKTTSSDGFRLYEHFYPYFSPTIMFAGGNYLPILMMILCACAFILLVIRVVKPDSSAKKSVIAVRCLGVAVAASLISSIIFSTMTMLSNIITAIILVAAILQHYSNRKHDQEA